MSRDVVVTGLGAVTAVGDDTDETWQSLVDGKNGVGPISRFQAEDYSQCPNVACEIGSEPADHPAVNPRRMGRYAQYAIIATAEALDNADLDPELSTWSPPDVGVSIGTGIGGLPEEEDGALSLADEGRLSTRFMIQMLPNLAAGHVSIAFDAAGPNHAQSTACAAGTHSICDAADDIRLGRADIMIAGGAEAAICPTGVAGFGAMRALSRQTDDRTTASRPFDVDRDGFVMSEGAGTVVLEAREHAEQRGATPLAELSGVGLSGDAEHPTKPHEEAEGLVRALEMALADAGCGPNGVDAVNAHATSTPRGDAHEAEALNVVFESCPPVTAPKSMLGHSLGASGAIEAVITVKMIQEDHIPPTSNVETVDASCDVPVVTELTDAPIDAVVSNSAGFGGTNGVLVFENP